MSKVTVSRFFFNVFLLFLGAHQIEKIFSQANKEKSIIMTIKSNSLILLTFVSTLYTVKSCDAGVCAGVTAACAVTCGMSPIIFLCFLALA